MSLALGLKQLQLFALCLCLVPRASNADLSFLFGNITLFNVNFKTPALLGRSITVRSNVHIDNSVDPNIQEDSHLNTVSTHVWHML